MVFIISKVNPKDQPDYVKQIQEKRRQAAADAEKASSQARQTKNNENVVGAINNSAKQPRTVNGSVEVTNLQEIAKTGDVAALTDAINKLNLTTFAKQSSSPAPALDNNLSSLSASVELLRNQMEREGLKELAVQLTTIVAVLKDAANSLKGSKIAVDSGLQKTIESLNKQIAAIDFKPVVNVAAAKAPVVNSTATVDLVPIASALAEVKKAILNQKFPPATDMSETIRLLGRVDFAIRNLSFPASNYVLPFKQLDNSAAGYKSVQVALDASGNIPVASSAAAPPGTLLSFITTVTTAGTRVQLASNSVSGGFILQAPSTNTGLIYVGGATVSSTVFGAELQPGQSTSVFVSNTNLIYIDTSVNGSKCAALGS